MNVASSQRPAAAARVQPGAVPRGLSVPVSSATLHERLLQLAEAERRVSAALAPAPAGRPRGADLASATRDSEVPSACDTLCIVSWDEEAGCGGGLWGAAALEDAEEQ